MVMRDSLRQTMSGSCRGTRLLVVSAVNLTEGGPLMVLRDCLSAIRDTLDRTRWRVLALVHDKTLVGIKGIHYLELPNAKRYWLARLAYEYVLFHGLSRRIQPTLW